MRSAHSLTILTGVSVGILGLTCAEPRYQPRYEFKLRSISSDPSVEPLVYRLDRETGEICKFYFSPVTADWRVGLCVGKENAR